MSGSSKSHDSNVSLPLSDFLKLNIHKAPQESVDIVEHKIQQYVENK